MERARLEHALETDALVCETYIHLTSYKGVHWRDRAHFFAVSAAVMRRILVNYARRHNMNRGREVKQ